MNALPLERVVQGDVYRALAGWPDGSVDLAVADPPYGIGKAHWDVAPDYDVGWLREVRRTLKRNGTLYVFGRPEVVAANWPSFPSPKRLLTWAVTNRVAPAARRWQPTSESIVMCWKGEPFFDADAVREEYSDGFKRQRGRRRPPTPGRFGAKETKFSEAVGALPRDVIRGPALSGRIGAAESLGHPAQKPIWLLERLVKASCPQGGVVADVFAGTATAAVAAHRLGRRWVAVEEDARWCEVAQKRLIDAGADARITTYPGFEAVADLMAWRHEVDRQIAELKAAVASARPHQG